MREMMFLVALAALAGATADYLRPAAEKLSWIGEYELPGSAPSRTIDASNPHTAAPPKDPGLVFLPIDGEVAQRLHKAGAFFIDARRSSAYQNGHIAGARNISIWEQDAGARITALVNEKVPFDSIIVIYCSGGNCTDSEMLAGKLAVPGYFNLYVYRQGFPDWETRHGPVNKGSKP